MVKGEGPIPARILICGESPGWDEERLQRPFVGVSGQELDRMLGDSGISRGECYITNVARIRPKGNDINQFIAQSKKEVTSDHIEFRGKFVTKEIIEGVQLLITEIEMVQPNIVIALGNVAMWVLTGKWGIQRWRGSMIYCDTEEM